MIDPDSFLRSCFARLKKGGKLVLSTPNDQWHVHKNMKDPLNLPPHHMGCFDPDVFERLATLYNQKLVSIKLQPCEFPFPSLSQKSLDSFAYKAFCKLNSRLGNRILQSLGEPVIHFSQYLDIKDESINFSPSKSAYSETFIRDHISGLPYDMIPLYGVELGLRFESA